MRIVHITSIDNGGAGRACIRLHQALLTQGVESFVLTGVKTQDKPHIIRTARSKPQKLLEKIRPTLSLLPLMLYKKRHKDIFSPNLAFFTPKNRALLRILRELKPDIIHLHWIENGFINIKDLLDFNAPLIWSLHDSNPYTGGCHYVATSCVGVRIKCKKCPLLNSKSNFDISYFTFKRKEQTYKKLKNLTINGLSKWIADCAKDSTLFKDKKIINLPNPINTDIYKPIPKEIAKELLGFAKIPKIITLINHEKSKKITNAFKHLKNKENIILFTSNANYNDEYCGIKTRYIKDFKNDISLIFSISDVVIIPNTAESFKQIALKSLSCGTPIITFEENDFIKHKKNGYIVNTHDEMDLLNAIKWALKSTYNKSQFIKNQIITEQNYLQCDNYKEFLKSLFFTSKTKYIAFGAISGTSIKRKGYYELKKALSLLHQQTTQHYELIVFGASSGEECEGIKTHFLGHINDDDTLKLIYNVSYMFIVPSLAENLSNAIMESLSCAVPVVAFNIGGNKDMIQHRKNGYLADDVDDLKNGIKWILELDSKAYGELCLNARKSVVTRFSYEIVSKKYLKAYQNILNGGG